MSRWGAAEAEVRARLGYGSYVSHRHRYLYVETPKAACTRLKMLIHELEALPPIKPSLTGPVQTKYYMYIHARYAFKMPSLASLPEEEAASVLAGDGYFRFCFVRNPYSRLVSVWRNKVYLVEPRFEGVYRRARELYPECFEGRFLRFDGFVRFLCDARNSAYGNPHWALQTSLLFPGAINYDFIGRVESFDDDLAVVEREIGVSFDRREGQDRSNASGAADWRSYYDESLADAVYALYRQDFEAFGYERDSWKGGKPLAPKSAEERFLENEIFERNRMIDMLSSALKQQDGG